MGSAAPVGTASWERPIQRLIPPASSVAKTGTASRRTRHPAIGMNRRWAGQTTPSHNMTDKGYYEA